MSLEASVINDFAKSISGEVFAPDHAEYEKITHERWNLYTLKFHPSLIVRPKSVSDIQATVLFGKRIKKHVVARSGAHSFKSQQDGIIVLDMTNFKNVQLDKDTGVVVVGAGFNLKELDDATAPWHVPVGIVGSTGAFGLALCGGVGFQDRRHGYTVDNILSAKIVTADGQYLTVSDKENSDLFWAIRGAGAAFGVVTEITFQSYRTDQVWSGLVGLPFNKENLDFFLDFSESIFENTQASYYVVCTNTPDGAMKLVMALLIFYGTKEEAEKVFAPVLGKNPIPVMPPQMKTFHDLQKTLDYPPAYWYLTGGHFATVPSPELRSQIVEEWNAIPTNYLGAFALEMRGGKASTFPSNSTPAPSNRSRRFDFVISVGSANPEEADNVTAHVQRARDNIGIKSKTRGGVPALNSSTQLHYSLKEIYGENAERLVAIKQKYDPENFFEGLVNILPEKKFA